MSNLSPFNANRQSGFTLIEVLLAMSITAITAVMAYQAMDSAGRLAEVAQQEGDDLQKLSGAMSLIAQDFRHISPRKSRDPEGGAELKPAFSFSEFALPML
ncbi:MAG: prepilin-type N-terminal cleavage/methylation domain-containing protein, partial [Sinobacterium sp.]|nr:prepilin-type N-terminal cleavage/methylation domain-containing protein [Sinobacterium sp.]